MKILNSKVYNWLVCSLPGLLLLFSFQADNREKLASEFEDTIINKILHKWYPQAIDKEHGGFLSTFSFDFKPVGPQDKMIVTQARHTWSNSKAAMFFPENDTYKIGGKSGYEFLKNVMWDKEYGGFFTLVDRAGKVKQDRGPEKNAYGNAFAIYALSAYYMASGDTSALNLAKKGFFWLEKNSYDPKYKGYFHSLKRDGTPIQRNSNTPLVEVGFKDQNSSIHLLEAFTELYQVWPDELVRMRLIEMIQLIRDTIVTKKGYLTLYFYPDWTPLSLQDSSEAVRKRYHYFDHVSFGHDVETAYLLMEASHVAGIENDTSTIRIAKKMVDHALRNGWDNKVGGFYDEGYYYKGKNTIVITEDTKNWWAQAEGLNTLLLMADLYPDDEMKYFEKFEKLWKYCKDYLIDHEHGDMFEGGLDKQPDKKRALKGHLWKGNYHQLRSFTNILLRLHPDNIPPGVPSNLNLVKNKTSVVLSWTKSTDNTVLLGYDIFERDKRIGFTPRTFFTIDAANINGKGHYSVKAVDLHNNRSGESTFKID
jgi:cellobiose epimerase